LGDPQKEVSDEEHRDTIASEEKALLLSVEKRTQHLSYEYLYEASCRPS